MRKMLISVVAISLGLLFLTEPITGFARSTLVFWFHGDYHVTVPLAAIIALIGLLTMAVVLSDRGCKDRRG